MQITHVTDPGSLKQTQGRREVCRDRGRIEGGAGMTLTGLEWAVGGAGQGWLGARSRVVQSWPGFCDVAALGHVSGAFRCGGLKRTRPHRLLRTRESLCVLSTAPTVALMRFTLDPSFLIHHNNEGF